MNVLEVQKAAEDYVKSFYGTNLSEETKVYLENAYKAGFREGYQHPKENKNNLFYEMVKKDLTEFGIKDISINYQIEGCESDYFDFESYISCSSIKKLDILKGFSPSQIEYFDNNIHEIVIFNKRITINRFYHADRDSFIDDLLIHAVIKWYNTFCKNCKEKYCDLFLDKTK
jgi:hypothetical protein